MDFSESVSSGGRRSYSPSADSTSADTFPAQAISQIDDQLAFMAFDHDDSVSDVSMPVETDDEDDELYGTAPKRESADIQATRLRDAEANSSRKRKLSIPRQDSNNKLAGRAAEEDRKRQRSNGNGQQQGTSKGRKFLPAEIWHHVFAFCPPQVLGKLLQVNKSFNAYLDPSNPKATLTPPKPDWKGLTPDGIWAASRRRFLLPGMQVMPAPLHGKSELDMWKLCCGSTCHFCLKKAFIKHVISLDKWHPGPGVLGVVPVFPLGLRSCGGCLQQQLTKEIDLMISLPSPLMAALPFVFMTTELHIISILSLQNGHPPPVIKITKYYYKAHVDEIKKEFENVKLLGAAAAEEWLKGLEDRGKQRMEDSNRWERWEAAGGLIKMRTTKTMERTNTNSPVTNLPPFNSGMVNSNSGVKSLPQPPNSTNAIPHLPQPVSNPIPATHAPPRFANPSQTGFSSLPNRFLGQPKHERTKDEVAGLKAARRSEIERRCMLLTPPLTAGVLAHMASFQAAIQIIQPLTDSAWEVLKPRLLSQREEAQQRENDRIAQTRVVQERFDERREHTLRAIGDIADTTDFWDEIQAPLRARIGGYADEIIRDGWSNGDKVSLESSPHFAAEVLVYVRKRFYAEAAKDEAAVRATGKEPGKDTPNGPYTWRLTLENMRWVFDTKVKPLTEKYRKELFLCNACDVLNKYYGFDGVIQHFAAKHTSALSAGPAVVHWKSEWPENPPFNPDPAAPPTRFVYSAASNATFSYPANIGQAVPQSVGYGGYPAVPSVYTPNPHVYQESPGPYYGHPQFGTPYASHQNGPFQPPPQPYPGNTQGYHAPQYPMAPGAAAIPNFNNQAQPFNQQGFEGNHVQGMYASSATGMACPVAPIAVAAHTGLAQPVALRHQIHNQLTDVSPNLTQESQRSEEYTTQLLDLARSAREIWNLIGGIKEIPGSVKVSAIIYYILVKFREIYQDDPPLSMIVEGLSNNKDMRPVRNINGLLCSYCHSSSATQKKHFSFPQLVNHFHSVHEQGISQGNTLSLPDWKKDMVLLPDRAKLASIIHAPGMDEKKLAFFTDAIPEILAVPEVKFENVVHNASQYLRNTPEHPDNTQLQPSVDNHEKYYTSSNTVKQEVDSTDYGQNEYDPRHPADLPMTALPQQRRVSHQYEQQSNNQVQNRVSQHDGGEYRDDIHARSGRHYIDEASPRPLGDEIYGVPVPIEGRRYYLDEPVRYREAPIEYRPRQELATQDYYETERIPAGYRVSDTSDYYANSRPVPAASVAQYADQVPQSRQVNDAAFQQNKVFEVVAQLPQHTQHAGERLSDRVEVGEVGSEDGEARVENTVNQGFSRKPVSEEAAEAAARFLDNFDPGEGAETVNRNRRELDHSARPSWDGSRPHSGLLRRQAEDPYRQSHPIHNDEGRIFVKTSPPLEYGGYQRQARDPAYDDRYASPVEAPPPRQARSPEMIDPRFKQNNTVYLEDRQGSRGPYKMQSRFARYESARLENDRVRSRSPIYVQTGSQPGQYRERSPTAHPLRQESNYGSQPPPIQHMQQPVYEERPRRQEYVQVYPEEQRQHEPQYAEAFEFVRIADPQGDYMIRRPVRREVEPVYASYEDEMYARQPPYENRAPVARGEPAFVQGEEYDPRHPEPPVALLRYH